jgi:hypothetical protein
MTGFNQAKQNPEETVFLVDARAIFGSVHQAPRRPAAPDRTLSRTIRVPDRHGTPSPLPSTGAYAGCAAPERGLGSSNRCG